MFKVFWQKVQKVLEDNNYFKKTLIMQREYANSNRKLSNGF